MLSKSYANLIPKLAKKKYRQKYNLFVVEGRKSVKELVQANWSVEILYVSSEQAFELFPESIEINEGEMKKISHLSTPSDCLAVVKIPAEPKFEKPTTMVLLLAQINDPGNLGTIIRLADWFGVRYILCEKGSVDLYNPKTIQASMGSFLRVNVLYKAISQMDFSIASVVGTYMDAPSVYDVQLPKSPYLVLGNEANGIPPEWQQYITQKVAIPRGRNSHVESLNVANATAILLGEFARRDLI